MKPVAPSTKEVVNRVTGFSASDLRVGQTYFCTRPFFTRPSGKEPTHELETHKPNYYGSAKDALADVTQRCRDGAVEVVFECRPIYKAERGKVQITGFK